MHFGKYQLVRKLAAGGMAEVFLAKAAGPMGFEKTLVLKRILPHLAEDPAFVEMFLGEAKLAAQLEHPNVVQIFDFGEAEGSFFLAMELIDGPSLRKLVKRAQEVPLPPTLCAKLVVCAAEGLAYAHDFRDAATGEPLGLIHRDVSPDNILVSRQGAVKVVDFGIAKVAGQEHRTQTGIVKGKVAYMPPEQLQAQPLDRRVDVYALGVVLYELLTGKRPFDATTEASIMQAILFGTFIPATQRRADLPAALQQVLDRALAKDREKRYPDCRALQADLERFIISTGESVGPYQIARCIEQWMAEVGGPPGGVTPQPEAPRAQVAPPPRPPTAPHSMEAPVISAASPSSPTTPQPDSARAEVQELSPPEASAERPTLKERAVEALASRPTVQERAAPPPFQGAGEERTTRPMPGLRLVRRHGMAEAWEAPPAVVMAPTLPGPAGAPTSAPVNAGPKLDAEDEVHTRSAEVTAPQPAKRRNALVAVAGVLLAAGAGVVLLRMGKEEAAPTMVTAPPTQSGPVETAAGPDPMAPPATVGGTPDANGPLAESGAAKGQVQETGAPVQPAPSAPAVTEQAPAPASQAPSPSTPMPAAKTDAQKPAAQPPKRAPSAPRQQSVVAKGTVEIRVRPFATVYLDGKELGQTPFDDPIEVTAGRHTLRLVNLKEKKDVTKTIDVKAGKHNVFGLNLMEEESGSPSPSE